MNILLIDTPYRSPIKGVLDIKSGSLGLAYVAASLEEEHKVRILEPSSPDPFHDIEMGLKRYDPDLVGLSTSTPSIYNAYFVAKQVKRINPNCKVVMGGPHVTFTDEQTLSECPECDFVVRGEGEKTMLELVDALERGSSVDSIRGITYRGGRKVIRNEDREFADLDELPSPARHLSPDCELGEQRFASIMSSRGCPYRCIFCSSSKLYGKTWRARSPESVVDEIKRIREDYNIRDIEFLDDTFTLDKKRTMAICDGIRREGLDIRYICSSRVDTIDDELARNLKRTGCWLVYIGGESGNQDILNFYRKGITLRQTRDAVKTLKRNDIKVVATFMFGSPGRKVKSPNGTTYRVGKETVDTMRQTLSFVKDLKPYLAQFTITTPYPGTALYARGKKEGLILSEDWRQYDVLTPVMKVPGLDSGTLEEGIHKAYLSYHFSPSYLFGRLRELDFDLLSGFFRIGMNYLGGYLYR